MVNMYQCYITDLDGTLCDTMEANLQAYNRAFAELGLIFNAAIYQANFGLRYREMMTTISPGLTKEQLSAIADAKTHHYLKALDRVRLNHDLVDLLMRARRQGAKIGLATTARRSNTEAVLNNYNLMQLFDTTVCGEDVTHGKPNPECYLTTLEQLGANAADTLVFEDSEIGISAAKSAGTHSLRVTL